MNTESKIFGVIAEWKKEGALILEGKPMNYCDAYQRMEDLSKCPDVIRVAMFTAVYSRGNETFFERDVP
jgi:hypothetical protein